MNELTTIDFGVTEKKGQIITSSRNVAEIFGKRHDNVIRDIENLISLLKNEEPSITNKFDTEFSAANFIQSSYKLRGREYLEYFLTKDGFTLLVMGFTGKKAMQFKIAYINRFNEMEEFIETRKLAKFEHPALTDALMLSRELEGKPMKAHIFSNESDMFNRIVLGKSAKQFKAERGLGSDVTSIRPYLSKEEINYIQKLQNVDIGLIHAGLSYAERKEKLTEHYSRLKNIKLIKGT